MPTPRTLHVVNRVSDRGDGIANVCVDVACEQALRGEPVGLACAEGGFVSLCQDRGVTWSPLELRWRRPGHVADSVRGLRAIIRDFAPEIIHAHTMRAVLVARLARGRKGPRIVATVHNEYQRGVILMGLADHVVGVSVAVSNAMARRRIPRGKISTVTNGVTGSARSDSAVDPHAVTLANESILALGAVSERKGADILISAFELIALRRPHAQLYFVGNIDWDEIPQRISASPVRDRMHLLGFSAAIRHYLAAATVFALASRRDPFPLVLLEALDAGKPIVASRVDGIPEALADGAAGILVPSEDASALAEALLSVLNSRELQSKLSAAAAERSAFYSVAKMVDGYAAVYGTLL